MKRFRDLAIGKKLTLVMMFISSATVLLMGITAIVYEVAAFRSVVVQDLSVQAEIIGENCAAALAFDDPRDARETLASLRARVDIVAACVYRDDGSILATYPGRAGGSAAKFPQSEPGGHRLEHGHLLLFAPVWHDGRMLGTVYLRSNLRPQYARLLTGVIIALGTMLASWILALVLAARLQRVISKPILDLAGVARNITERQDYSLRARKHGEDELGNLTTGFNRMLEDIQERDDWLQRAYSELRSSDQRFRQFAEAVREVFWMTDPEKNETVYVSPAYEVIWGRTSTSLYENPGSWLDAVHPQDRERVRQAALAQQSGGAYDEEYRVVRPDGSTRWIRDRAFPVRDAAGKLVRVAGIAEDITERKKSDETLRLHDLIVKSMAEGVCLVRASDRVIIYANPTFERMFGYEAGGLLGKPVILLNHHREGKSPEQTAEEIIAELNNHQTTKFEIQNVKADGTPFWCEAHVSTFDHPDYGRIWVSVHEDVTERKEAEAAILRQAQLLDLAREGIFVRDMLGTITFWNRGAEQMYGWTRQEAVGRISCELLHTTFPKPWSEIEEDLLRVGYWDGELTHTRRDGNQLVVESRWALSRDEHGHPVEILEINNDTTERKRAEKVLRRLSVRLQRAQDQERRRIARELHDSTGQNLAALSMNLSIVGRSADALGATGRKALGESMALVEGCIREVRTLSYLLHPPMLDERGLAPALRWFVEGFSKRSGMKVDLKVPADWDRLAPDEEIALFRVVQESLVNAHRHSKGATARIRLDEDKTAVRLEVEDYGTGLTEPPDGGWPAVQGVGIAGMRERIKELGGELQIESGTKGTTVRVTMPLGRKAV